MRPLPNVREIEVPYSAPWMFNSKASLAVLQCLRDGPSQIMAWQNITFFMLQPARTPIRSYNVCDISRSSYLHFFWAELRSADNSSRELLHKFNSFMQGKGTLIFLGRYELCLTAHASKAAEEMWRLHAEYTKRKSLPKEEMCILYRYTGNPGWQELSYPYHLRKREWALLCTKKKVWQLKFTNKFSIKCFSISCTKKSSDRIFEAIFYWGLEVTLQGIYLVQDQQLSPHMVEKTIAGRKQLLPPCERVQNLPWYV